MDNAKTALLGLVGATEDETKASTTTLQRLDNLEATTDDIILMMADLIGGDEK